MTIEEKIEAITQEIQDLYTCLDLMPKDSVLGMLSIKATIKSKERKLNKLIKFGD